MKISESQEIWSEQTKDVDLVFEGGGLKGIGLVGAYSALEERGYRPKNMAGASAGAVLAALVAAGYTAAEEPVWPTIGLKIIEEDPWSPFGHLGSQGWWFSIADYARRLIDNMMEAHDRLYLEESDFHRTIAIDPRGIGTTQFDVPRERILALYDSGRAAAEEFLATGFRFEPLRTDA